MNQDIIGTLQLIGEEKTFKPGDIIFEEGSMSEELCFVLQGRVGVERKVDHDEYLCTFVCSEGEFFGEMAIFQMGQRLARIKAFDETTLIVVKQKTFNDFIEQKKEDGIKTLMYVLESLFVRMKHTNREMSCFYQLNALVGKVEEAQDFINAVGKILHQTLGFDAYAVYSFNVMSSEWKLLSEKGVTSKPLTSYLSEEVLIREEDDLMKLGIKGYQSILFFPLVVGSRLVGQIILFKKSYFRDNEKLFLKAVLSQIDSLLDSIFYRKEKENKEKIERRRFEL